MSLSSAPADDRGISVSGDMADFRALDNGASSGTAAPRVISPPGVPGDAAEEQHSNLSLALSSKMTQLPSGKTYPVNICAHLL
jgi:hypothetical protein